MGLLLGSAFLASAAQYYGDPARQHWTVTLEWPFLVVALVVALFLWLLPVILGAVILSRYNKSSTGILLGLFLSWIGVIIALVIRSGERSRLQQAQMQERHHQEQLRQQEQLMAMMAAQSGGVRPQAAGDPASAQAGPRKFCGKCGNPIDADAAFCGGCGAKRGSD